MFALIVTPTHDGKLFQNYVVSLLNTITLAPENGVSVQPLFRAGESLITRARNDCVATFLDNPQWTHLFFIDSDIGWNPEAFFRLVKSGYDIAAGAYPLKRENYPDIIPQISSSELPHLFARYTVNNDSTNLIIQEDGFIELNEAPTGFMCIKREVFLKLMEAYPNLKYVTDSLDMKDKGLHYRFFDCIVHPESKRYLSEDYAFCKLWNDLGGKVYVDAFSNLTHQGMKTYEGNFYYTLNNNLTYAVGAKQGEVMTLIDLTRKEKL